MKMTLNRFLAGVVLLALTIAGTDQASASGSRAAVRKQMEMNMLISGTIDVSADGRVGGYHLDQVDKLPRAVLTLIARNVPHWTFSPRTSGEATHSTRARMGLNIVAAQAGADRYDLRIHGASFFDKDETSVRSANMSPPVFPEDASMKGITGTAYVVLKIGRTGQVEDLVIEQVNLNVLGDENQMHQGRDMLSRATRRAARAWTFSPPTSGELADDAFWVVRVPVDYVLDDEASHARKEANDYGKWRAYIPGPRTQAPWKDGPQNSAAFKPDAMLAGMSYTAGSGLQLLTPLDE